MSELTDELRVLIVDDTKENIDVLAEVLSNYKRSVALSGEKALRIAKEKKPDIILLDIMMPEMDGFEVCRRLKSDPDTQDIPIIFITAKNQVDDEVRGLELGAVDFISKPISPPIVTARIKNHLDLKIAREKIETKNQQLELTLKELKETQNQLILSEKMASLGQLVASIAHEINTPLGAISSSTQSLFKEISNILNDIPSNIRLLNDDNFELFSKLIQKSLLKDNLVSSRDERNYRKVMTVELQSKNIHNAELIADLCIDLGIYSEIEDYFDLFLNQNILGILSSARSLSNLNSSANVIKLAIEKVSKLVFALKNYSRHDNTSEKKPTDLNQSIDTVLTLYHNLIKQGINVEKEYTLSEKVNCFPDEINQVWTNIIHNAIYAMNNKGTLFIGTYQENEYFKIIIRDDGPGIPVEIKNRIFEPFYTTKPEGEGTGLGLSIVSKIIEKHNGKLELDSEIGKGSTFKIFLPLNN